MNIVLIGMPGCGKSTIGVVLAKSIGYKFIDTDILIQEKTGKLLQDILDKDGTDSFLKTEESVLLDLDCDNCVIATGGSAVYSEKAMEHLKTSGKVVYIKVNFDNIVERLNNLSNRGVVGIKDKTIKELFDERTPLYEKYADFVVECNKSDISENMQKIRDKIGL